MSDTILGSMIGLLGVIVGWGMNRLTATHTMKKQEFYKAAAAFRLAFIDEIRTLKNGFHPPNMADTFVQSTLSDAAAKHENACIAFSPYLSARQRRKFDEAWKEYCCPEGGNRAEDPSPFIDYIMETRVDLSIRMALEKIDKLMEFAKHI